MALPEYLAIIFDTEGYDPDILIAFLADWPFESFHEEADSVTAYIRREAFTGEVEGYLMSLPGMRAQSFRVENVPDINWNARWEESFTPVPVDADFYIRAEFHPPAGPGRFRHELLIAPRMAFGTGHHATTFMMLQALSDLTVTGKDVLDFGCGTGILAVAAAKEGAAHVHGIDIQPEAIENSQEHARLNHVEATCTFAQGGQEILGDRSYDIILANINTWVIGDAAGTIVQSLRPGGWLLLSGILEKDGARTADLFTRQGLVQTGTASKDGWVRLTLQKRTGINP